MYENNGAERTLVGCYSIKFNVVLKTKVVGQ